MIVTGNGSVRSAHALSFDVEEHFQVSAFWSEARRRQWDQLDSRVELSTRKIAQLLALHSTKATFFVLGWVAERHPNLIRDLAQECHEIASHGYGHELVSSQTPSQFRDDIRRSKGILEDLIGAPVVGYRAPSFSITERTSWALPILVEEGYRYDSSIYCRFQRKHADAVTRTGCYALETQAGLIWEVPPSTLKTAGFHLPVAGGGYFRLFPYSISRKLLRALEGEGAKLVMYFHPWELDPDQPRMDGPVTSRMRHYLNLHRTEQRLRSLLGDFTFGPINEVVEPVRMIIGRHQPALCGAGPQEEVFQCQS
jgi:polysaccharide deacetylase family protein (PEP-CTERM system associated)